MTLQKESHTYLDFQLPGFDFGRNNCIETKNERGAHDALPAVVPAGSSQCEDVVLVRLDFASNQIPSKHYHTVPIVKAVCSSIGASEVASTSTEFSSIAVTTASRSVLPILSL